MFTCPVKLRSALLFNLCLLLTLVLPSYGKEHKVPPVKPGPLSDVSTQKTMPISAIPVNKTVNDGNGTLYTIKAGDNLFKILMREYGLTSRQAERFIEIVRRENKISNFRQLRIGQKIYVSSLLSKKLNRQSDVDRRRGKSPKSIYKQAVNSPVYTQVFRLQMPTSSELQDSDITDNVKKMWGEIVSEKTFLNKTVNNKISVSFDPLKYPILTAMDGSRILVDVHGKIPPSIKSIIAGSDPGLSIVSESTTNPKRFLGALIHAGKFYSSSENSFLEFGHDPKLTIRSDFMVERTAESIVNQDVILLSAGKVAYSSKLKEFLKKEGFSVYEPFALIKPHNYTPANRLIQVTSPAPLVIASTILKALSITAEENARINIVDVDHSGISISISTDLYFHHKGKTFSLRYLKDNSVDNSLIPILAANGIDSIVLNHNDDFRKVSEAILSGVGINGSYGFHYLWPEENSAYSLQLSGMRIEGAGASGESLFLTDREIDRIIRDISAENGFIFQN